jgi:hypothetical protein
MSGESPLTYVLVIRTWFDRINGNSYFGGEVIDARDNTRTVIPFQYGHGDLAFRYAAEQILGVPGGSVNYRNSRVSEIRVSRKRDAKLAV